MGNYERVFGIEISVTSMEINIKQTNNTHNQKYQELMVEAGKAVCDKVPMDTSILVGDSWIH